MTMRRLSTGCFPLPLLLLLGVLALLSLVSPATARRGNDKYRPLVSANALQSLIELDDLLAGAQQLEDFAYAYPERNRVFGGPAHRDTVNYLYRELSKTGYYNVYKQEQVHLWSKTDQNLTVSGNKVDAQAMTYSPGGAVTAELAVVKNAGCDAADYPAEVAGKIALIQRGSCTFGEKSVLAGAANAVAAIVYNNVDGSISGTLGEPSNPLGPYVPVVGISLKDGRDLAEQIGKGPLTADLSVLSELQNRTTHNVIAQTKGGDPNNVVALGGHTDSVEAGPGINDDGSGIISNLVIAKALTKFSVKNAVRFLFWTAEEFGLLGSEYYVSSLNATELDKIKLYLNFDMIASPNFAIKIYDGDGSSFNQTGPPGSAEIEHLFQKYFESRHSRHFLGPHGHSYGHGPTAFDSRSDYAAFIDRGIPAGGIFTGAEGIKTAEEAELFKGEAGVAYDVNYHKAGDNMRNLNHEAFLVNSRAAAYAVARYATSLEEIPARNASTAVKRSMRRSRGAPGGTHGHGASGCFHSRVAI